MFGYATALGADLNNTWSYLLVSIDMLTNSPYFWPCVIVSSVIVFLGARLLSK